MHLYCINESKKIAIRCAVMYTVNDGRAITSADKGLGDIRASQTVSLGKEKRFLLNIVFEPKDTGSQVSMTYSTSSRETSSLESIHKHFLFYR